MKIRNGFVSNSSSSSFLINVDSINKDLIHYNYKVKQEESIYEEDEETFDFKKEIFRLRKDILEEEGFIFDELATQEYHECSHQKWNLNAKIYSKVDNIEKINGEDLGRYTGIAIGSDIFNFIEELEKNEYYIEDCKTIRFFIKEYGIDNLALLRESDEGCGGYLPEELAKLRNSCLYEFDYH